MPARVCWLHQAPGSEGLAGQTGPTQARRSGMPNGRTATMQCTTNTYCKATNRGTTWL